MATDVSICSTALQLLGDRPIASLLETSPRAVLCNSLYEPLRDQLMRSHPWNCLVAREALSPLTDAPVSGWAYQFTLPTNCLRVLSVGDVDDCAEPYELEGRRILSDASTVYLRYIERKSESHWDANLVDLMIARMQVALAYPITKSTSLRDQLQTEFNRPGLGVLARAKAVDGQENPPEDWGDSPLITVRG